MNSVTFNGVSTEQLGTAGGFSVVIENVPKRVWPDRKYEMVQVNGRNGDLIVDYGSYSNTKRTYNLAMASTGGKRVYELVDALSKWLHSGSGYCRLTDTFEPDRIRFAAYAGALEPDFFTEQSRTDLSDTGVIVRTAIEFNCRPQLFEAQWYDTPFLTSAAVSASGQSLANYIAAARLSGSGAFTNPGYTSEPMLIFKPASGGNLKIHNLGVPYDRWELSWGTFSTTGSERIVVDSMRRDIYMEDGSGSQNNQFICVHIIPTNPSYPDGDYNFEYGFPLIPPGDFTVQMTGVTNYEFYKRSFVI